MQNTEVSTIATQDKFSQCDNKNSIQVETNDQIKNNSLILQFATNSKVYFPIYMKVGSFPFPTYFHDMSYARRMKDTELEEGEIIEDEQCIS
jgi:hypothetical protein